MSTFKKWKGVNWRRVQKRVDKLQTSILKNSQTYKDAIVKVLQQRLINSTSAKLLAVRKVTQDNRGKNTPGVDGIKSVPATKRLALTRQLKIDGRASPIRRVFIPKPGRAETVRHTNHTRQS
jgi:RNA-directed DNA polymerase